MKALLTLPAKGSYWYSFDYPKNKFQVFSVKFAGTKQIRLRRIGSELPRTEMVFSYPSFIRSFKALKERSPHRKKV